MARCSQPANHLRALDWLPVLHRLLADRRIKPSVALRLLRDEESSALHLMKLA